MENAHDTLEYPKIMDKLQRVASGGWLIADLTESQIICSTFIVEKLGLNKEKISFKEALDWIHPEDRENAAVGLELLTLYGTMDAIVRIRGSDEYVAIHVKFGETEQEEGAHRFSYGIVHILASHENFSSSWDMQHVCRELKYWQDSVPRSLMMLLENKEFKTVISDMLQSILSRFQADRVYLFEYSKEDRVSNCTCIVTHDGILMDREKLRDITVFGDEYWEKELEQRRVVAIDNVCNLPFEANFERQALEIQNVISFLLGPLGNREEVWGYLAVDVMGREHRWTKREKEWFMGICNVISICLELRHTNSRIRHEREYLQYLQTNMPLGIEVYDPEGYLVDSNPRALEITGINTKQNVASLKLNIFDNPFIPEEKRNALRRGESISCEICGKEVAPDSSFFGKITRTLKNVIFDVAVLYDEEGRVNNYLGLLSDRTEIMEMYSKLSESQKMFSLISDFSEVGFARINSMDKSAAYEATDQWFKNLNITREDTNFASGLIPNTMHPEDVAGIRRFMNDAINGLETEFCKEIRVRSSQGEIRWLRLNFKVAEHKPEKCRVILSGLSVDITQQKNEERILVEAKMKAEASDKLKSAFLANMSHEIRTPLNAIMGFSTMIADDPASELNEEFASLVRKNNDLLLQIVSDILDLAKIEAGIFETILSRADINQLCEEVLDTFSGQAGDELKISFIPSLPRCYVLCDQNRIIQILNNFMSNSLKFSPKGEIQMGYTIVRDGKEQFVEFYVSDTGKGMSPEQKERCFERFYKADSFVQGTGLGLSICKELVGKLNGSIGVESEENTGSRFWFRLPFMPAIGEGELNDEFTVRTLDGRKPVILVAEDTMVNFLLISSMLMQYYTVIIVQNGLDAVRVHAEKSPDLILMDLKMPKMDGLEATRRIRQKDKKTPIVAITAFVFEYDRKNALESGFNYIIIKPIDQVQLRKIVKKLIQTGSYNKVEG